MKEIARQRCTLSGEAPAKTSAAIKCLTVMVFEMSGKTILQPLLSNQDTQTVQELLQNKTLEMWLSNGKTDPSEFDVSILKYRQVLQPEKRCSKTKNRVCLKNHIDTIVSCEQCPLNDGAED